MQIMPTTSSADSEQYFYDLTSSSSSNDSFAEELERQRAARDAVANDESHSVQVALETSSTVSPLQQAPYNLTTNDGVTYTADEVLFTQQELQELLSDLLKKGAPESTLEELRKLAEQPGGSSLAEVKASLQNERTFPALNKDELKALETFAGKIDPSGKLYGNILGNLAANDGKGVLEAIVQGMNSLGDRQVSFDKSEMAVLGKSIGLSDESAAQLLNSFGNGNSVKLNQTQLTAFLAPAFNDFNLQRTNQEQLGKALEATLGEITRKAKERMELEQSASELSARKVEQSKALIEKTVLENVNNTLENTRLSQEGKEAAQKLTSENIHHADKNEKSSLTHSNAIREKLTEKITTGELLNDGTPVEVAALNKEISGKARNDAEFGKNNKENANSKHDAWGQLLQRAETRTDNNNAKNVTTPVLGIGGLNALQNAQANAQSQAQASRQAMSQQAATAAAQVESALLTAAKNGTTSLELQLHPQELGALTIILTSRNGEVSAMLRSEKSETTEMLNKQMEQIRTQLEGQGIKIDKLEAQTGTKEQASNSDMWDSLQQHNKRQEENAQREHFERMRNLATVRNSGINTDNSTLERNMHNEGYMAGNATQSLYIVA